MTLRDKRSFIVVFVALIAFAAVTAIGATLIGGDSETLVLDERSPDLTEEPTGEQTDVTGAQPDLAPGSATTLSEPEALPESAETPGSVVVQEQPGNSGIIPLPLATPDIARNTNVDVRSAVFNTPSDQIPADDFTQAWSGGGRQNITEGCTGPNKCLGQFRSQCTFSHFGYNDPIALPGQTGGAHLHMFFGNTGIDANSNGDTILNSGNSTCNGLEGNRTGYWVPAVFDNEENLRIPDRIDVYYKSHGGAGKHASINDFPEDFRMIAGSHLGGNDTNLILWQCGQGVSGTNQVASNKGSTIPNCNPGETLQAHLFFPQCISPEWSADNTWEQNKSTLSNTNGSKWSGNCNAGDTKVPLVEVFLSYPVTGNAGTGSGDWFLSSDIPAGKRNGETLHGDWYGGWNDDLFSTILTNCIQRVAECSWDLTSNNTTLTRVAHFNSGLHPVAYDGPVAVSAEEVTRALCPGDEYNSIDDAATCESAGGHAHG